MTANTDHPMTPTTTSRKLTGPYTWRGKAVLKDGQHYSLQASEYEALEYADRANRYLWEEDAKTQALNVLNQTGLLPSQLLEKLREAKEALEDAEGRMNEVRRFLEHIDHRGAGANDNFGSAASTMERGLTKVRKAILSTLDLPPLT